ncbi:MAG: sugar ABC transporter permease, partial [Candidatus Eremiobacteraeota bacterium]|nr:sugar ABC transporter permease [Candidatus Eremiobacteraeota bacterium]
MKRQERLSGWLFVAPTLFLVLVLAIGPIVYSLGLSFFIHDLSLPQLGSPFVGLDNYRWLLRDSRFWFALYNTIWFTVVSVSLETVLGLLIALMINQAFFGRGLVRATILIPWAVPTVVGAQMWRWIYNDKIGVLNDILRRLGILSEPYPWIASIDTAAWAVVGADVWKTTPFMALLLLAGLQTIPDSLYEAADVDGADTWQQFWNITLPNLRPVMLVAVLFRTLDAFRIFDLVYVLTGGAFSTETLSVLTADVAFGSSSYGLGS